MSKTAEHLDDCRELYEAWKESPFVIENSYFQRLYPQRVAKYSSRGALLDLGLGTGSVTAELNKHFDRHVVVEGSECMIDLFHEQYPDLVIDIHCDLFESFSANDLFEAVSMGFVLEHVDNPLALLERYKKFLQPGGRIFIGVPNGMSLNRRFGYEAGILDDYFSMSDHDRAAGHQRTYTLETLRQELWNAGLSMTCAEGMFLKPMSNAQMHQLQIPVQILNAMAEVGLDYPELCSAIFAVAELM